MARPLKEGLNYFPFDVDFFEDEKLFDVQNEYGPLGEIVYIRLLVMIYKDKGYYLEFKSLDKLSAILIRSIGNRWARNKQIVSQVILFLVECNLFSPELMQENVLTSVGIQRRYAEVTGRRKTAKKEYWLLSDDEGLAGSTQIQGKCCNNEVTAYNNPFNDSDNATKKTKVNKTKLNESSTSTPTREQVQEYCNDKAVNADKFYLHYQARGWKIGNTPITDWRALVDTWDMKDRQQKPQSTSSFDIDVLDQMLDIVPSIND